MDLVFTINLTDKDWDGSGNLKGWRVPALMIPGAQVEKLYGSAGAIDEDWYRVKTDTGFIRWTRDESPPNVAAHIKLTKELTTEEKRVFWRNLAIILPPLASILVAIITVFGPRIPTSDPCDPSLGDKRPLECIGRP